mmetsp:Transcript_27848/g.47078  ORF Transcript_27848/g.47078 Transcript_27848/m.47078 type:complete len:160 (-) Transcript_27848:156-635(-)
MSAVAISRLSQERKNWRKDHPAGFIAKPMKKADNSMDLMNWEAYIPGEEGTDWEGGVYKLTLAFPPDYPAHPPVCTFTPPLFHPNLYTSGKVCLSIVNEGGGWSSAITLPQVLQGIQAMLDNPNNDDPAHGEAYRCLASDKAEYRRRIRAQAKRFVPKS